MEHAGTTASSEPVGGSPCGGELSSAGGAAEMINDSRSDANRKVLIKGVSEHLLPTAQACGLGRRAL